MKIGIPRAGLYYIYFPFWKAYFEALGFEVILSPPTDRNLLEEGLKVANSEICLPMKVMYGHVLALKDEVDVIVLPQMDEAKWGKGIYGTSTFFCPYFVGLADVMRAEFPETKFWQPLMSFHNNRIEAEPWVGFADKLGKSAELAEKAVQAGQAAQRKFRQAQEQKKLNPLQLLENKKFTQPEKGRTIGLVGRPYLVFDEVANLSFIQKLNDRGYRVETLELIPEKELYQSLKKVPQPERSHWLLTNEEYGALYYFAGRSDIIGIIYLIPFNCGPDFRVDDLVVREIRKAKSVTTISIDESTGEAGLATRLDAFLDMLK
ncbi:acyl-CoA dehydratase activase-related protein [Patescibacteria group bacterium]